MNDPIDIELIRGQAGLGFNIKGGIDIPHIEGDPGIFIAKIREKGAAADDGRLCEGDKIIEINGHNVEKVQHQEAVSHFLNAGSSVKLKVIQGAENVIKKSQMSSSNNPAARPNQIRVSADSSNSSWSHTSVVLLGMGVVLAVFIGYRFLRKT